MKRVYIGAGHSGSDSGAAAFGRTEATTVMQFRDVLARELSARGVEVLTDGAEGENKPLRDSIAIAQTADGPRLEFHLNAGPIAAAGVEVLSLPVHKALAQKIAAAVSDVLGNLPRGGDGGWKSDSSGQHHRLGFCREGGGLVVELFFITNQTELRNYDENRDSLAVAIANVLVAEARA